MKNLMKNNKWLSDVFPLSIFFLHIISNFLDIAYSESLLHYKISTIFFLVSRLLLIMLIFEGLKHDGVLNENYKYKYKRLDKILAVVFHIIEIPLIIYTLWTMIARLCGWDYPF